MVDFKLSLEEKGGGEGDSASSPTISEEKLIIEKDFSKNSHHPRNWPSSKRWKNALIISVTGFLSTTGSSIFVPASLLIQVEFNAKREVVILTTALYVLGLGFGPFLFAPISELKGRQVSYSTSMIGFTLMNLGCAFAPNLSSLIIMRFISGVFGSSGPGLGVATISDLFAPNERGKPIAIYSIGPMMGPVLGSIIGNYLVLAGWRWTFRLMTILVGLNTLAVIFGMDETYAPVVQKRFEQEEIVKEEEEGGWREILHPSKEAKDVIVRTFTRPPRMLINPVCAIFVAYYSYVYSIIYVYLVSLPLLFSRHNPPLDLFSYNWPATTAGLCYLGLGFGFLSAAAFAATMQDKIYKYLSARYNDSGRPEYRLVVTQCGMIIFPIGLLIWSWTAERQTIWIGPIIGSAIFAFGLMLAFNSIQNWIVDAFFPYSAAAMAAASLMRSIAGCLLPIFSESLFEKLGYGWGGTLLALISLLALPAPLVLFLYGKQLRERFKFEP